MEASNIPAQPSKCQIIRASDGGRDPRVRRVMTKRFGLLSAALAIYGFLAAGTLQAQRRGQHPDPQYIQAVAAPTVEIRFNDAVAKPAFRLSPTTRTTIGTEAGAPPTVFSSMTSAILVDDSTIAIIEESMDEVRIFATDGRHLQTIGRKGSGPGEFRRPVAIVVSPQGELLVSDMQRKLHVFVRGPKGFAFDHAIPVTVSIISLCYLGDTLYVSGATLEDIRTVRALDSEGNITASFGTIYDSPNPMVNWQVAQGRIVCNARHGLVLHMAGALLGEVRAYRTSGELAWRVRVPEYRTNIIHDLANGFQMERSPNGVHSDASLFQVADDGVLAQWAFMTRAQMEAKEAPTQIHSIWIDAVSGTATNLGTGLPLLADAGLGIALAISPEPVPQLMVHSISTQP